MMEMDCLFFGENEKAYFKYEDLEVNRQIGKPIYPREDYGLLRDSSFKYPMKKGDEVRFVSCDIATMSGNQNDVSAFIVFKLTPSKNGYERQIVYMDTMSGGHTETQALKIRQLYEEFDCDYIVLDTQNAGIGVYDQLCIDLYDRETGEEYSALSCMNDERMAERCLSPNAPKVIFSVKATQSLNSEIAITLKDALRRGKLKMLVNETDGKSYLRNIKGYDKLSAENKAKLEMPYYQTSALINEIINLSNEGKEGVIRLKEPSGGRKDRWSSLSYGNYFANTLEKNLYQPEDDEDDPLVYF